MFIEVYNEEDKNRLMLVGYKLFSCREVEGVNVYTFVMDKNIKFNFSDIKFRFTNKLMF